MITNRLLILGLLAFFATPTLCAQVADSTESTPQPNVRRKRKFGILPVPSFGYSPETRGYIGAVALMTFNPLDSGQTRSSNWKAEVSYTQNRQFITEAGGTFFTPQERWTFQAQLGWRYFPELFWGIGRSALDSTSELYSANRASAQIAALKRIPIATRLFIGPEIGFDWMYNINYQENSIFESQAVPGRHGSISSGLGVQILWDTRHNLLNPNNGHFIQVRQLAYTRLSGSEYTFYPFTLDARKYWALGEAKHHIIGIQGVTQLTGGAPPVRQLALLGSDSDMRGYYQGRIRDRQYASIQLEYRAHLFWRIGLAAFGGLGNVGYNPGDLFRTKPLPSYGGGLRFLIDRRENINLRLDFAAGANGSIGFYAFFGEAF